MSGARILDGRALSAELRAGIVTEVEELRAEGLVPGLAVVLVGDDPASAVYVSMKARACHKAGMTDRTVRLPADISRDDLFDRIDALNADPAIHGILVQLPLPPHLDPKAVLERIRPEKDVDGFHPLNVGRTFVGDYAHGFAPATPAGIVELLRHHDIHTHGRHVVVVGRSLIVGKPLAALMGAPGFNATITLTHRHTRGLAAITRMADILVVVVGKPKLITRDMVKPGATVIDVGISRIGGEGADEKPRVVGDVDFEAVREVAGAITPVPGGVGPMTITMLMRNTLEAALRIHRGSHRPVLAGTA